MLAPKAQNCGRGLTRAFVETCDWLPSGLRLLKGNNWPYIFLRLLAIYSNEWQSENLRGGAVRNEKIQKCQKFYCFFFITLVGLQARKNAQYSTPFILQSTRNKAQHSFFRSDCFAPRTSQNFWNVRMGKTSNREGDSSAI